MRLTLAEDDVGRLNDAAHTLLSPSEHPSLRAWADASERATRRFLRADRSIMVLLTAGGTVLGSDNIPRTALDAVREAITLDDDASADRPHVAATGRGVIYVALRAGPAGRATLAWGYPDTGAPDDALAAARLLLPAFRNGVRNALTENDTATPTLPGIHQIMARHALTRREAQVTLLLAHGASNREAAARLGISAHTVRKHAEHVFTKLDIHSRKALALVLLGVPDPG